MGDAGMRITMTLEQVRDRLLACHKDVQSIETTDTWYKQGARAIEAAIEAREAEPVAWRVRIGASDTWGYCESESDADFIGKQSGMKYEKQPLYTAPPAQPKVEVTDNARDAARYRFIREHTRAFGIKFMTAGPIKGDDVLEHNAGPWLDEQVDAALSQEPQP